MNTLFRVLYTAAMQWRTLLMYCGPQGEAAYCWSPLGREMVRLMPVRIEKLRRELVRN